MVDELDAGYRRFRETVWPTERSRFRALATAGQKPHSLVIACSDSRVDPALLFQSRPGELFVVRNVANLVPPCEHGGLYHGTSAAIEFAVTGLGVRNILVMGHSGCGGIAACLAGEPKPEESFIGLWMRNLAAARKEVTRDACPERALEHLGVRQSLANLMSFPFVAERVEADDLRLLGAWFEIESGRLLWLDDETSVFRDAEDFRPA
ncbi:MAG: carbonic anhydrase [Rhodothalassiaceae bacterium]